MARTSKVKNTNELHKEFYIGHSGHRYFPPLKGLVRPKKSCRSRTTVAGNEKNDCKSLTR